MRVDLVGRGLILGLSIAAAVGPMAILCIRRTLTHGQPAGLATGLGIATADGWYALIAALGLTVVSDVLVGHRNVLQIIGGLFLCYLGAHTMLSSPALQVGTAGARELWDAYASAAALTLTNPTTILSFAAVFAALGLGSVGSPRAGALLVFGVFLGSCLWWLCLTTAVVIIRERLTQQVLRRINWLTGGVILTFGLMAIISALAQV
jgi:threonine/homoserine/homoserine lactone efflux protein